MNGVFNHTDWPFFDFVLFKNTTETNTFNVDLFNDTERYWMVFNGIEWYTIGRFL